MVKVRDLDLVLIPAHPGYHVVFLDLEDDVVLTEATTTNDIAESLEPVIAWALEARVYDDPRLWRQRGPQSVGVSPITPSGVRTPVTLATGHSLVQTGPIGCLMGRPIGRVRPL